MKEASTALEKRKNDRHFDRVTLDSSALQKIDSWIDQVKKCRKGTRPTRKEIVNWCLNRYAAELSSNELKELSDLFFDEVRFLQQSLRELKAARARGECPTLDSFLEEVDASKVERKPRKKSVKKDAGDQSDPEALRPDNPAN